MDGPATGAAVTTAATLSAVVAALEGASGLVVVGPDGEEAFGFDVVEATVVEGFLSATDGERRKQTKKRFRPFQKMRHRE